MIRYVEKLEDVRGVIHSFGLEARLVARCDRVSFPFKFGPADAARPLLVRG